MTLDEFKAWFDGFTEEMSGPPTEKQWGRIKKRVDEIDGVSPSFPIFVDRYYRPYWSPGPFWTSTNTMSSNLADGAGRFAIAGRQEALSCS